MAFSPPRSPCRAWSCRTTPCPPSPAAFSTPALSLLTVPCRCDAVRSVLDACARAANLSCLCAAPNGTFNVSNFHERQCPGGPKVVAAAVGATAAVVAVLVAVAVGVAVRRRRRKAATTTTAGWGKRESAGAHGQPRYISHGAESGPTAATAAPGVSVAPEYENVFISPCVGTGTAPRMEGRRGGSRRSTARRFPRTTPILWRATPGSSPSTPTRGPPARRSTSSPTSEGTGTLAGGGGHSCPVAVMGKQRVGFWVSFCFFFFFFLQLKQNCSAVVSCLGWGAEAAASPRALHPGDGDGWPPPDVGSPGGPQGWVRGAGGPPAPCWEHRVPRKGWVPWGTRGVRLLFWGVGVAVNVGTRLVVGDTQEMGSTSLFSCQICQFGVKRKGTALGQDLQGHHCEGTNPGRWLEGKGDMGPWRTQVPSQPCAGLGVAPP
nr:uncharacterized protein LOC119714196 isoform X3 [Anas platyrhynchos]